MALDTEAIIAIASARNAAEAWKALTSYTKRLGLDGALWVGNLTHKPTYLNSYPEAFFNDYIAAGGADADSCVQVAVRQAHLLDTSHASRDLLIDWRTADRWLENSEAQQHFSPSAIEDVSNDHKIRYGFSYCYQGYDQTPVSWGLGFGAVGMNEREFDNEIKPHALQIKNAATLFRRVLITFEHPEISELPELSPREEAILNALAEGFTIKQMAGLRVFASQATINKEIDTLKQKLSAGTQTELVYKALSSGLIR